MAVRNQSMMDYLVTRTDELHGRGINLFVVSIIFGFAAVCMVVLRVLSRGAIHQRLGCDDHVIIVSTAFSFALSVTNCISVAYGNGKKISTLPPLEAQTALQAFWVAQITYKFTISLTKISICLLYLRIFTSPKWFRRPLFAIMTLVTLYTVASVTATIVQCTPVARTWNHSMHGTCIDLTVFWYANAAANIFSDLFILILPMPVVAQLHLPERQKWGLALIFGLGGFVCVTSVLRMVTLEPSSKAADVTYGNLTSTVWTTIEANVAIICACLPMLRAPFELFCPCLFPRNGYDDYYSSSSNEASRRRVPIPPHEAPTTYDSWGRYLGKERSQHTSGRTLISNAPKCSRNDSRHGDIGGVIDVNDIPLGQIAKTTHFNVHFPENKPGYGYAPSGNQLSRSVSRSVNPSA